MTAISYELYELEKMNMSTKLPPPMLIADHEGLDFLNTIATPVDVPVEWIGTGNDFLLWLEEAKFVSKEVLDDMRGKAGPGELDAIAAQARSLREWFREFVNKYSGKALPSSALADLTPLNSLLARDEAFKRVVTDNSGLKLIQERRWRSPDALLTPIAEAIAELITDEDFTRVKACEGHNCSIIFLDKTRRHGRRWCSMAICGNRAKQSAHRLRQR